jgi:hypothetical protein
MVGMARNAFAALAAVLGLLLVACQPSGYTYVRNNQHGAYVKFPRAWHYFGDKDLLKWQAEAAGLTPGRAEQLSQMQWAVAFDADPKPSLDHLFNEPNGYPIGFVQVRQLSDDERDQFSIASLRNQFVPFDSIAATDAGRIELLSGQELIGPDGLRGLHMRFTVRFNTGNLFTYDQTAYVDAATEKVYLLAIGCTVECFKNHTAEIEQITSSWTIKEPPAKGVH